MLQPKDFDRWLGGNVGTEALAPATDDYLQVWPVPTGVNSSWALGDDPILIDRIATLNRIGRSTGSCQPHSKVYVCSARRSVRRSAVHNL
jgi:hypothetical protein